MIIVSIGTKIRLTDFGMIRFMPFFNILLNKNDQNDGNDAVRVIDQLERNDFKQTDRHSGRDQSGPGRMHENERGYARQNRIALQFLSFA